MLSSQTYLHALVDDYGDPSDSVETETTDDGGCDSSSSSEFSDQDYINATTGSSSDSVKGGPSTSRLSIHKAQRFFANATWNKGYLQQQQNMCKELRITHSNQKFASESCYLSYSP